MESRGAAEVQRGFWGCSGDRLREGCGRGEDQGEVGLRRNCELGSAGCESWSYGARERNP